MTIYDKIKDEKLQYYINRQAAKVSVLSSGIIDKCKYLTSEEILPLGKKRVIEEVKFTYSTLSKAFQKQIKAIEEQGEKQIRVLEEHGKQFSESNALVKRNDYDTENKLLFEEKEIYDKIAAERKKMKQIL